MRKLYPVLAILLVLFACSKEEEIVTPPAPNKYTLTITAEAGGSVSSQGGTYNEGSKITITATPDGQYLFEKWSDGSTVNPREITVTSNLILSANFVKKTYPLAVTIEGEGTVQEEVIIQGSTSETEYNAGTTVRLTATPNEGWVFAGWSGDVESDALEIEVPIEKGMSIVANFSNQPFRVRKNSIIFNYDDSLEQLFYGANSRKYFLIGGEEYFLIFSDKWVSLLFKRIDYKWELIDEVPPIVTLGSPTDRYIGSNNIVPISENEFIVASSGEFIGGNPKDWGSYVYIGKIENDQLFYQAITNFKDYYSYPGYGDITGDGRGDVVLNSGWIFIQNSDGSYQPHNISNATTTNQGDDLSPYKTGFNLFNLERYSELQNNLYQVVYDLYPGGREEVIMCFIDVSDNVSEDDLVPRGDVLIYEYNQTTNKYEVAFELPRRTVGEVETVSGLQVADINNDGINDLIIGITSGDSADTIEQYPPIEIWLGNEDKSFSKVYEFSKLVDPMGFEMIDVNNDGYLDIVLNPFGDNADWIRNHCTSDCYEKSLLGLPTKDGLILDKTIYLNKADGTFEKLSNSLVVENSFSTWLVAFSRQGNLAFVGATYKYVDGQIMDIEFIDIEILNNSIFN